jgi:hypothetical protein
MDGRIGISGKLAVLALVAAAVSFPDATTAQDWSVLEDKRPPNPDINLVPLTLPPGIATGRVLLAGDSWAQYMWDDGSHNDLFDRYGHAEKLAVSQSLASNPDPPYTGPGYAVSGSEARQWTDTANYPWIANTVAALNADPTIDTVVLSIGGNDFLAGKPDGGWYKDMDLDVPGSEAAFIAQLEANTLQIADAAKAVRPDVSVMISSYDYPNFNVGAFWCLFYACQAREDLSRDPQNDLITDAELNGMMVTLETARIGWANADSRLEFDHAVGLMHHFYGDGVTGPGLLPKPGTVPPNYLPFPGGNPALPSLRANFRVGYDPIHLSVQGYEYKIVQEIEGYFFPHFRGDAIETFFSQGGANDGWTDGTGFGTNGVLIGDNGPALDYGILSFDTSSLPDGANITGARFYMTRESAVGMNPFASGALGVPTVDVVSGSFGAAAVGASDAFAAADFVDAGFLAGTATDNGYAVGVQIDPTALSGINTQGLTQFRMYFPSTGGGAGSDAVTFADGDATSPPGGFPTLAAYMGTSQPFLDVSYESQVGIADDRSVETPRLLPNSPNPFSRSTSIRFVLAEPGPVRLEVFDIQGRRIATVRDGLMPAGGHAVTWNGRDERGVRAASGIYLAVLRAEGRTSSRRLVLLAR